MPLIEPLTRDAIPSRQSWVGAALVLGGLLGSPKGSVLVPFGLALAITPFFSLQTPVSARGRNAVPCDLLVIALLGSAATAAAFLWPQVAREPARLAQLLSDLFHKGPELWGNARVKSPPEILNTLQGCVQPDRISQLPYTTPLRHVAPASSIASAFAALATSLASQRTPSAWVRSQVVNPIARVMKSSSVPVWFASGRSPPGLSLA